MSRFEFIAGARPLDFVNTVSWGDGGEERLPDYEAFIAWCRAAGLASGKQRDKRVFDQAIRLRATLHSIFLASSEGRSESETLNPFLTRALRHLQLGKGKWTLRDPSDAHAPLWLLTWEAANLLTNQSGSRIGRCSNDRCLWLFIDESRRHNRRWCDMQVCGSRAKARAYYARRSLKRSTVNARQAT